jgi:PLP dependent protein
MSNLKSNYQTVRSAIASAAERVGRDPRAVQLVAVTKTVGIEEVRTAFSLGMVDFGENRVQDAVEKVTALPEANWHFIGHLQSNKVKDVLPVFKLIHSLDRQSLADALQKWAEKMDLKANVLIQVNVSGENSKFGLAPQELPEYLEYLHDLNRVWPCGLMTMAPYVDDAEEVRPFFRQLRQLRDLHGKDLQGLKELSMGMTNDYEIAVEEGATIVRIGSAIFS